MSDRKCINLDELRQPGMRRIVDAMRQVKEEAPSLLGESLTASITLAKRDKGHLRQ